MENPLALYTMDDLLQEVSNRVATFVVAFEIHLDEDRVFARTAFKGSPASCIGLAEILRAQHHGRAQRSMDRSGHDDAGGEPQS